MTLSRPPLSRDSLWIAGFCLGLITLLLIRVDGPWQYIHDDNGAFFRATASAHLLRGWSATLGQDFFVRQETGELVPYLHHPPLLSNLLALVYRLTGSSQPVVGRLVMIGGHLVSFALFVTLSRRVFDRARLPVMWAIFVFAVTPISVFFGKSVGHEPLTLTWYLWFLVSIWGPVQDPRETRGLAAAGAALVLAGFTSWPGFFVTLPVLVWYRIRARDHHPARRRANGLLGLWAVTLLIVGAQLWLAGRGMSTSSTQATAAWFGIPAEQNPIVFGLRALGKIFDFNRLYFGNVPTLLSLGWFVVWGARVISERVISERVISERGGGGTLRGQLLIVALGQLLYIAIFLKAARVHAYHQMHLIPFVALSSAVAIQWIHRRVGARSRRLANGVVAVAAVVTLVSSLVFLQYRYRGPYGYAVQTSARLEQAYAVWDGRSSTR